LKLIESIPGVDAVVIDAEGRMFYSSGLMNKRREVTAPAESTSSR